MKTPYVILLGLVFLFAISCKESEQEVTPTPTPPGGETQKFTLSIKPSSTQTTSVFTATVTIEKEDGSLLYNNATLALTQVDGKLISNAIDLAAGKYKLTKLLVKDSKQNVIVAAPLANSAKATGSINSLPFEFTEAPVTIESASVNETDLPEEFGYEPTSFGETPYLKVKVKSVIYIAGVEYRPETTIKITSGSWTKEIANNSEALLPKKFENYQVTSNSWSLFTAKFITSNELRLNPTITLENSSVAKRLKEMTTSKPVAGGGTIIDSKTEYFYNQVGLDKIFYHQRDTDGVLRLQTVHKFNYSNSRLVLIEHVNPEDKSYGRTILSYNGQGKISSIDEKKYDTQIIGTFSYPTLTSVEARYSFDNGNTMTYNMNYFESNKVNDGAFGNGSESGKYTFDDKVNPFHLINYPDLFLSNSSKNNKLSEEKSYGGNIPSLEQYKTEYKYDEQGYPEIVIKNYRGYASKEHLFKTVTEYTYY